MEALKPPPRALAEAVSYAVSHGILIGQSKQSAVGTDLCHAPFTLMPSPVDRKCYKTALSITRSLNTLVYGIATDHGYLRGTLRETAEVDEQFTGRLMQLVQAPHHDDIYLSICRYDYFIHAQGEQRSLCMVEMNCIAASFAALGTQTSRMHLFLACHPSCTEIAPNVDDLPQNDALSGVACGIAAAHNVFLKKHENVASGFVALMVVQPGERNAYDQYGLQKLLWQEHKVDLVRASLIDIAKHARIEDNRRMLRISLAHIGDDVPVSVVYFRAGYTPDDYPSNHEWEARALIERSSAVKCPSIPVQLVGTKKIQQVLTRPGEVERFLPDTDVAALVRQTFVTQLSLSPEEDADANAQCAINNPLDFVLKPQREGGGNNLYGEKMKQALQTMSPRERSGYILMQRIRPVEVDSVIVRNGENNITKIVSELGVFGVHIVDGSDELDNFVAGTLLRSKSAQQDDGGVAAGVAVLDSPCLVD